MASQAGGTSQPSGWIDQRNQRDESRRSTMTAGAAPKRPASSDTASDAAPIADAASSVTGKADGSASDPSMRSRSSEDAGMPSASQIVLMSDGAAAPSAGNVSGRL
jgi:hypothetical protein